jgi:DNA ligase-1
MQLLELAEALEHLEHTRSRATAVEQNAALLSRAGRRERASIVYVLQARLRPNYEGIEVGLGEKLLVRAIGAAYHTSDASRSTARWPSPNRRP